MFTSKIYDSKSYPKDIAIEGEEELNEDDKEPTTKNQVVKAIKGHRDDNMPVDLLKEQE